jgi:sugar lactone lactonase YvrE
MRRIVLSLLLVLFALPAGATASSTVEVLVSFNPAAGELPEGLAVDKTGNIYLSFTPIGKILEIRPDGSRSPLATLPTGGGFGPTGLAVDAPGNLYAADVTDNPATRGVYRIGRDGTVLRLPGSGAITFPNGLAFDQRGNLYVTDSALGAVWRFARGGGAAELWIQNPLLAGTGALGLGFPLGANGIAYRNGNLFVTNTEGAQLARIPVRPDGSAGTPELVVHDAALFGADGLALDVHGNFFVAVSGQSTLLRISADGGPITTLATAADGLDFDSSLAFGTGRGDRKALFLVNFALFDPPATAHPALLRLGVGVPGMPLP